MQPDGSMPSNQPPEPVPIQMNPVQQQMTQAQPVQPMLFGATQQPMMGQQIMIQQNGNGMAVTGLVMGILGIVCYLLGWLICVTWAIGWLFGILAIIFGHLGHGEGKRSGTGEGQGVAGFILGYLTILGYLIPLVFLGGSLATL
ncbi:MAG: DUF4190 domain-containing protein [Candidatus Poseidoniaceae archaeon]|nr:DUF4190 domain-containing protein [Candidatus Poseidoniaceae archaeon]